MERDDVTMLNNKRIIGSMGGAVAAATLVVAVVSGGGARKTTLVKQTSSTVNSTIITAAKQLSGNAAPAQGKVLAPRNSSQSITTPKAALQRLLTNKAEVKSVSRSAVKETTWATYLRASGSAHLPSTMQVSPSTKVWVVVVGGTFIPQFAHSNTYSWGAVVYKAATGTPLNSSAGSNGWPSWFTSLS